MLALAHPTLSVKQYLERTTWHDYRNQIAVRNGVRMADQIDIYLGRIKHKPFGRCLSYDLEMIAEDFRHLYRDLGPAQSFDEVFARLEAYTKKSGIILR